MPRVIGVVLVAAAASFGCGTADEETARSDPGAEETRANLADTDGHGGHGATAADEDPHAGHGTAATDEDPHAEHGAAATADDPHAEHAAVTETDPHAGHEPADADHADHARGGARQPDAHAGHAAAEAAHADHAAADAAHAGHAAADAARADHLGDPGGARHADHAPGRAPAGADPHEAHAPVEAYAEGADRLALLLEALLEDPAVQRRIREEPALAAAWAGAESGDGAAAAEVVRGMAKLLELVRALTER